jgi:hypothetical protein
MADFFHCYSCQKVAPLLQSPEKKCPLCGSTNGDIRTASQIDEMMKAGAVWNIDPKTGGPAKKKRKR